MDFKYRHTGFITEAGRIEFNQKILFDRQVNSLRGCKIEFYLRKERTPASLNQKAFYVGVVLKEAHRHETYFHYDKPIDLHSQVFGEMFLKDYKVVEGKLKPFTKRLSHLSMEEMSELTERVIAYLLTEDNIVIGEPKNYHVK